MKTPEDLTETQQELTPRQLELFNFIVSAIDELRFRSPLKVLNESEYTSSIRMAVGHARSGMLTEEQLSLAIQTGEANGMERKKAYWKKERENMPTLQRLRTLLRIRRS